MLMDPGRQNMLQPERRLHLRKIEVKDSSLTFMPHQTLVPKQFGTLTNEIGS